MKLSVWVAAGAVAAGLLVTGCGGDDTEQASGGGTASAPAEKSGTITVPVVLDQTGPSGFAGAQAIDGINLAVEEANADKTLGDATLKLDVTDPGSDPRQAANLVTAAVRDDPPIAVYGPTSGGAVAAAPIAQRAKVPLVTLIAGSPGIVEAGDYVYRATAPPLTYHDLLAQHLENEGMTRIAQAYNNDVPTNTTLAKETWPALAKDHGLEITSTDGFALTATNFGTIISKIVDDNPDAVLIHLVGAQHVSFATALQRAGYKGLIAGGIGLAGGTLKPMGAKADGIVYVIDFTPEQEGASSQAFVEKFREKYGKDPNNFAANGYDAMQLVIKGLAEAPEMTPEGGKAGLDKVTAAGFDGATGKITFEERDARVPGVLVEWRDGKENPIEP